MHNATAIVHNATVGAAGHPPLPGGDFSWGGYFQAIGVMLLLLAALWVCVWLMRKYGRFRFVPKAGSLPHDALYTEAQLPLGPRRGLLVVRFMDKRLLLGVTEAQITLLQEAPLGTDAEKGDKHVEFKELLEDESHKH